MRLAVVAFALGVWLLQQQPELPAGRGLWLLPLVVTPFFLPRPGHVWAQRARLLLIALATASVGFAWAALRAHVRMADHLPVAWQGVDVRVEGVVSGLPDRDPRGERFDFRIERILTAGAQVPAQIRLAWPAPQRHAVEPPKRLRAGERWRFTVRLKPPHGTANPDGFDYEAWLLAHNIRATGYVRESAPPEPAGQGTRALDRLQALRETLRDNIGDALKDHPQAGVILALVVGDQGSIPHANWRVYNRTGTSHLMSISGLHITLFAVLVGGAAYGLWRRWPALVLRLPARRAALLAGWLAAAAYTLLAGFQIPAQRTLFMLTVLVLGLWLQREPRPFSLLLWALLAVLLLDPWAVLAPGFWLSFGAVAAMMWAGQGLLGHGGKLAAWTRAQAAVTLALAPALLLLFHQISLVSPLANALAIPVVSWGVVPLALAGTVVTPLLSVAAWLMQGVEALLHALAGWPWASWVRPAPNAFAVLLAVVGTGWLLAPALPARWLGGAMCLPLLFPPVHRPAPGGFEAEVLDVGQGTAVLIRTARHALLYDTGPAFGESDAGQQIILPRLRALGIGRLDGLILTHDDLDHTGGAASILRDTDTGWLMSSLPSGHGLLDRPSLRCVRGQRWQWDGVDFEVLNPPAYAYAQASRKDNDKSCVLRIAQGRNSLLLTADAERIGELEMTERVPHKLASTVLMVGHHGSRTSSIEEFVRLVRPLHVIYSTGWKNRFGHPHHDVLARFKQAGAHAHRTDAQGWVWLAFTEDGVSFRHWRDERVRYWQHGVVK